MTNGPLGDCGFFCIVTGCFYSLALISRDLYSLDSVNQKRVWRFSCFMSAAVSLSTFCLVQNWIINKSGIGSKVRPRFQLIMNNPLWLAVAED